jgi:proline dehydrogenase
VKARVRAWVARRYVAGAELADGLAVAERLRAAGMAVALGYWDGAGDTPQTVLAAYRAAAAALGDGHLSVKPPSVEADALATLEATLHFDSLAPATQDASLALAGELGAGVTLPGRWRRSVADAPRCDGFVRVVKGQWPDPDEDARDGFAAVVGALAGRAAPVGVATHDGRLAQRCLERLLAAGTPCELQLLYGLPPGASLAAARRLGIPVRAYVPYGRAYLPYALGELRRHPRRAAWLARDLATRRGEWVTA